MKKKPTKIQKIKEKIKKSSESLEILGELKQRFTSFTKIADPFLKDNPMLKGVVNQRLKYMDANCKDKKLECKELETKLKTTIKKEQERKKKNAK